MNDHELAAELAAAAGRLLLGVRQEFATAEQSERKSAGDMRAQAFLAAALAEHRPNDQVFSEEAVDDPLRLTAERLWIVDPLDGTREFSEPGRQDWAVHVALWQRHRSGPGGDLVAGAVALPAQGLTFSTPADALSAYSYPRPLETGAVLRIIVSRTRPPAVAVDVCNALAGVLAQLGSAGAKAMAVVQGHADIYIHAGGQYEWDSAAPVAVARAAGLHATRLDGSPLEYNRPEPLVPDLLICRPELAASVLTITRQC